MKIAYSWDWKEIALAVKESAGWRCQNCGHLHDPEAGYMLTVHHIDSNPQNNEPWNLVALCQRCHLHYQRPLYLYQLSFYELPQWKIRYFEATGLNSSPLKDSLNSKLPASLDTREKISALQ